LKFSLGDFNAKVGKMASKVYPRRIKHPNITFLNTSGRLLLGRHTDVSRLIEERRRSAQMTFDLLEEMAMVAPPYLVAEKVRLSVIKIAIHKFGMEKFDAKKLDVVKLRNSIRLRSQRGLQL
jgi:hypothetical protein